MNLPSTMLHVSKICVTAALVLTATLHARAATLADSVADFSATQGQGGWFYGYYAGTFAPTAFALMPSYTAADQTWAVDRLPPDPLYYTVLNPLGGHPNGVVTTGGRAPVEQWAVRRWVSGYSGTVQLSGNVADLNGGGGNGVIGRIFVNGVQAFSADIANADFVGVDYALSLNVGIGTVIDFAIDPKDANDLFDLTRFQATISAPVPEPADWALWLAGTVVLGAARTARRRRPGANQFQPTRIGESNS